MKARLLFRVLLAVAGAAPAIAASAGPSHAPLAVSVAFDDGGRLWRARVLDGALVVDHSDDRGTSFSVPRKVAAEPVAADGELRPDIAAAGRRVFVAWTSPLPAPYAGNVRFARSLDAGETFEAPLTVNDNREAITHRFQRMHLAPDGRITLVWIDKRDSEQARRDGRPYRGAGLYAAESEDGGASFRPNARFAAHSCECCRIALASDEQGRPLALWRHVFADGSRDHALARVTPLADADVPRASEERWRVNACPHHGPDLAVATDGTRHGVWFNQLEGEPGLFYRGWSSQGAPLAAAVRIAAAGAAHPAILSVGQRLLIAWKRFDGEQTVVELIESQDGGRRWSAPRVAAAAADASDYPQLLAYRGDAWLSWATAKEGWRLIPLADGKGAS